MIDYETDEVVLHIESGKYLMTPTEAMQIAAVLNSCSRITIRWRAGGTGIAQFGEPETKSAVITPMTPMARVTLTQNMKDDK